MKQRGTGPKLHELPGMPAFGGGDINNIPIWDGSGWTKGLREKVGEVHGKAIPNPGSAESLKFLKYNHATGLFEWDNPALMSVSAVPTTSGSGTGSTADPMSAVIGQMSITADFLGRPILVLFSSPMYNGTAPSTGEFALYAGGTEVPFSRRSVNQAVAGQVQSPTSLIHAYTPAAGSRTYEMRFRTNTGTFTAYLLQRSFTIIRLI